MPIGLFTKTVVFRAADLSSSEFDESLLAPPIATPLSGEIIVVVSGRMTVEEDGQPPVTLEPGDTAYFPLGWKGVWTVHERLRKIYVVYVPKN